MLSPSIERKQLVSHIGIVSLFERRIAWQDIFLKAGMDSVKIRQLTVTVFVKFWLKGE